MLHGQLVVLRQMLESDLPNNVRWLNDPEVLAYFGMFRPMTMAREEEWFEAHSRDPNVYDFACDFEGNHVGGGGLFNVDHQQQSAEVGLFIGERAYWNRGLGRDMLRTLVTYGFDHLNLHRIYLRVFAENERAIRAYESVGFVHEGRFREVEWRHGRWLDQLYMSVLRDEWPPRAPGVTG